MKEAEYIVATDLAKLRIAESTIRDTRPEHWTEDEPDIQKLTTKRNKALIGICALVTKAEHLVSEASNDD